MNVVIICYYLLCLANQIVITQYSSHTTISWLQEQSCCYMCIEYIFKFLFFISNSKKKKKIWTDNEKRKPKMHWLTDFAFHFQLTKRLANPNSFVEFSINKDVQKSKVPLSY